MSAPEAPRPASAPETFDCRVAFAEELSSVNPSGGSYEIRPVSLFNPVQGAPLKVTA